MTFLPSQQIFPRFDIVTVIEQAVAKQKHVDQFWTHKLGSLVLYRSFQPNVSMLIILLLSNVSPTANVLADLDVAVMVYRLTQDAG